jgi:trehalose-6-phosphatase
LASPIVATGVANSLEAVGEILRLFPSQGLLPIYLGDDQTDEDGFETLKGKGL